MKPAMDVMVGDGWKLAINFVIGWNNEEKKEVMGC